MVNLKNRIKFIESLIIFVFFLFTLGFLRIQVLRHSYYKELSIRNLIRRVEILAPRGSIIDRNGRKIVGNREIFSLSLKRDFLHSSESVVKKVSKFIFLDKNFVKSEINKKKDLPHFIPVLLKKGITFEELSLIEARKTDFPEVSILPEYVRYYPYGGVASHILGYIGFLSREDAFVYGELNPNSPIGKYGIERFYDSLLRGENGWIEYIVDSHGKIIEKKGVKPYQEGKTLKLTLDINMQSFVEEQLKGEKGAIVVMDPRDGGILALASSPSFDLNIFTPSITHENWLSLSQDTDKPLLNKAIQGLYSPGSIFKIVLALAGLNEGLVRPEDKIFCPGYVKVGNQVYRCWKAGGHGNVNLYKAIVESCNVYFYNLGMRLGPEKIKKYATMLGLGETTGIDIPGEMAGIIPDQEWKEEKRNEPWYPGDTVIISIGQGLILLTPLQVANLISTVANNGIKKIPHLLQGFIDENGRFQIIKWETSDKEINLKKEYFEILKKCMWGVVNDGGTGRAVSVPGFDVCGKTGTVEVVSRGKSTSIKPHAWFAGFAPLKNPEIVIVVILENAGKGGERAAPIARNILLYYLGKSVPSTKTTEIETVE
ncbi:MAG: penicillin-binding protein 2 [Candidatus Aminicenantia bacterium]